MFSRLDKIPACDGQTDGQTSCHGIVNAIHTRCAVKTNVHCALCVLVRLTVKCVVAATTTKAWTVLPTRLLFCGTRYRERSSMPVRHPAGPLPPSSWRSALPASVLCSPANHARPLTHLQPQRHVTSDGREWYIRSCCSL